MTRMPALLALQHGRPIVAGACFRNFSGGRYRIELCEPICPGATSEEQAEIGRLIDQLDRRLAQLVRAAPEQYL